MSQRCASISALRRNSSNSFCFEVENDVLISNEVKPLVAGVTVVLAESGSSV